MFCKELFALRDEKYRDFHAGLIPNVDPARIIGVRMPALRTFARKIAPSQQAYDFLHQTPHFYYEENNLHGLIIGYRGCGFEETLALTKAFLPLIDNWATCDLFAPTALDGHPQEMLPQIYKWLGAAHPYTVRFGVNCMMRNFMDQWFDPDQMDRVDEIAVTDYYVKMGIAWYYSVALVKQWTAAFDHLSAGLPDPWIQNKSIQKACESRRLSMAQKEILRKLKIKRRSS